MKPASRKRVRRVRKPLVRFQFYVLNDTDSIFISSGAVGHYHSKEARKLAAWLVRAADYLEQKQKGPK